MPIIHFSELYLAVRFDYRAGLLICRPLSISFYQHTQKDGFALSPVGFDAYKNLPPYTALKAAYHRKQFWIVADQRVSPDDTTYYKHLRKLGGKVSVNLDKEDDDEEEEEEVSDGLFDCHCCGSSFLLGIMDAHLEVCQVRVRFSFADRVFMRTDESCTSTDACSKTKTKAPISSIRRREKRLRARWFFN